MIIIGLGSNVGDRAVMLDKACDALALLLSDMRVSVRYETPAMLPPDAPPEWDMPFLNMAVAGTTPLSPHSLLAEIQRIEKELGKQKRGHWGPREIDVDLLIYDNVAIHDAHLQLPHPEILNRYFVLAPLVDVAPELVIAGKTARVWLAEKFP
jgi:2-amino-4-hydroxy-6-hydroxymethyldihydropteridine diphosphokinase